MPNLRFSHLSSHGPPTISMSKNSALGKMYFKMTAQTTPVNARSYPFHPQSTGSEGWLLQPHPSGGIMITSEECRVAETPQRSHSNSLGTDALVWPLAMAVEMLLPRWTQSHARRGKWGSNGDTVSFESVCLQHDQVASVTGGFAIGRSRWYLNFNRNLTCPQYGSVPNFTWSVFVNNICSLRRDHQQEIRNHLARGGFVSHQSVAKLAPSLPTSPRFHDPQFSAMQWRLLPRCGRWMMDRSAIDRAGGQRDRGLQPFAPLM